jgi:hypothetical protein
MSPLSSFIPRTSPVSENPSLPDMRTVVFFTPYERKGVAVSCSLTLLLFVGILTRTTTAIGYGRSWCYKLRPGFYFASLHNVFYSLPMA